MIAKSVWLLLLAFASLSAVARPLPDDSNASERPKLPRYYTALDPISSNVYDIKAEPVARVAQALRAMHEKGWVAIAKYYPELGRFSDDAERRVSPGDFDDHRFFASFATEEPGRSPIPLISMIASLSPSEVSGRLAALRQELLKSTTLENYDSWQLADLNAAIEKLTESRTDVKHVKYRAPKTQLTFLQNVQLYAMTVALLRKDTKWVDWAQRTKAQGHTMPPMPDMEDFANRLSHQLPVTIPEGATVSFLLYRPGDIDQPVAKGEFEERADVVSVKKTGATFTLGQFPVYLTADQKQWNPAWIDAKDEGHDTTLMARKYEYDWTRFDGPYLWFQHDQLNGSLAYEATVQFPQGSIVIEAERFVSRRGGVMRVRRDPKYDPSKMPSLALGAESTVDLLAVDWLDLEPARPMPPPHRKTMEYFFYRTEGRTFLTYQISPTSSRSCLYPPAELMAEAKMPKSSPDPSASAAAVPVKVSSPTPLPSKP